SIREVHINPPPKAPSIVVATAHQPFEEGDDSDDNQDVREPAAAPGSANADHHTARDQHGQPTDHFTAVDAAAGGPWRARRQRRRMREWRRRWWPVVRTVRPRGSSRRGGGV